MSKVKERLLALLEERRGSFVSGQDAADMFGVSRMAVSKAAEQLRAAGYNIESRQNNGYRLTPDNDLINDCNLRSRLKYAPGREIIILDECDSTNTRLRGLAHDGAPDRTVVIAGRQSAGKGRYGKSFYSPPDSGLYMSVLIRPGDSSLGIDCVSSLTVLAGVAVAESIRALFDIDARIKWVNDVLCNGKKLCGILTEAQLDAESRSVTSAVIGIGVNVRRFAIPQELAGIACAVEDFSGESDIRRSELAAQILNRIDGYLDRIGSPDGVRELMSKYRALSCVLGGEVSFVRGGKACRARAVDIAEDGALVVRYPDGSTESLRSGEISIKPL